jgi:guanine nucleotide-binding protein G(I)/G(S)/G(T) subunit beta-1
MNYYYYCLFGIPSSIIQYLDLQPNTYFIMADIQNRIKNAKEALSSLTSQLEAVKRRKHDGTLGQSGSRRREELGSVRQLACIRTFTGHTDNITSMQWSGIESTFVSAGKDGQLIVWNGITKRRVQTIKHNTQWLMTCAFETGANRLVATGGADKVCSVFVIGQAGMTHPTAELKGHDGYLSACSFVDDNNIISASGDSSAILWDISRLQSKLHFTEHAADCLSVAVHPSRNTFATGSADCTAKLWDIRSGRSTHMFSGHESDINSIKYFPDGYAVGTASTDSTCKIFDSRSFGEVASFESDGSQVPASSGRFAALPTYSYPCIHNRW